MAKPTHALARSLRVTDVLAIGLNGVIGSGIFLLPGKVADKMGPSALLATLFAGFLCFLIALCFAEVGSRFTGTGGAYLYARAAFGDFVGFQVGWMTIWVRLISTAALAAGFSIAFLDLIGVDDPGWDKAASSVVLLGLGAINLRTARLGASVTTFFTVIKLIPLFAFVIVGFSYLNGELFTPFSPHGYGSFGDSVFVILWAFVGFEILAIPGGEMRSPERDVPRALLLTMGLVTVVYLGVQVVAIGTLPTLAGSENPVAEASRGFMGSFGGGLIGAGIALSVFGSSSGSALVTPRALYALAEQGQLPRGLAAVHPTRRVPTTAIIVSTVLSIVIALSGSFEDLIVISVIARFVQYMPTCVAVLAFRRRDRTDGAKPGFRIPMGPTVPLLATLLCLGLLTQADPMKLFWGGVCFAIGIPFYFLFARRAAGDRRDAEPPD